MLDYKDKYDVVICGAGLAGLTIARQLLMQLPSQQILLIDKQKRPLPVAEHKVGESTVHPGGTYLCNVIKLREYLENHHLEKYGFRYFYGSHKNDFGTRTEMGRATYDADINEFQIDRGIFENDLREMVINDGATLAEGAFLKDIEIGEGEEDHLISFKTSEKEPLTVKAKWVIDATGRRQFLSRKLALREEFTENCSASWVRVKGRFDVSDLVPQENKEWHDRVSKAHPTLTDFSRYNSTNHVVGYGSWIWIIPLVSGHTSIGLVTHNDYHDFTSHNSLEKMKAWLWKSDEKFAAHFEQFEILDYRMIANYAHTASQVFSKDRWACTGEAGIFSDPFQSPGTDAIALANCYIKELMQSDLEGNLTQELVDSVNLEFLEYSQTSTRMIQASYPAFFNSATGSLTTLWYLVWSMCYVVPNMRFRVYKDGYISGQGPIPEEEYAIIQKMNKLGLIIAEVIRDWAVLKYENNKIQEDSFSWVDQWDIPSFRSCRDRMVNQELPQWQGNLEKFVDFATGLYMLAIEDVLSDTYDTFTEEFVPNVWGATMKPEQWKKDGVFDTKLASPNTKSCIEIKEELKTIFLSQKEMIEAV